MHAIAPELSEAAVDLVTSCLEQSKPRQGIGAQSHSIAWAGSVQLLTVAEHLAAGRAS